MMIRPGGTSRTPGVHLRHGGVPDGSFFEIRRKVWYEKLSVSRNGRWVRRYEHRCRSANIFGLAIGLTDRSALRIYPGPDILTGELPKIDPPRLLIYLAETCFHVLCI